MAGVPIEMDFTRFRNPILLDYIPALLQNGKLSVSQIEDENDLGLDFMPLCHLACKIVSETACVVCIPNISAHVRNILLTAGRTEITTPSVESLSCLAGALYLFPHGLFVKSARVGCEVCFRDEAMEGTEAGTFTQDSWFRQPLFTLGLVFHQ